jgi:hypothetical protein
MYRLKSIILQWDLFILLPDAHFIYWLFIFVQKPAANGKPG